MLAEAHHLSAICTSCANSNHHILVMIVTNLDATWEHINGFLSLVTFTL